jgi:hypothetical protein
VQSVPSPIPQNPAIPPLQLSNDKRDKIRQALSSEDTEVTFTLKKTQSAKSFEPAVGAVVPTSLTPLALPRPLIYQMPLLKRYTYLKLKQKILIVNPLNRKIVEMFPEGPG